MYTAGSVATSYALMAMMMLAARAILRVLRRSLCNERLGTRGSCACTLALWDSKKIALWEPRNRIHKRKPLREAAEASRNNEEGYGSSGWTSVSPYLFSTICRYYFFVSFFLFALLFCGSILTSRCNRQSNVVRTVSQKFSLLERVIPKTEW